MVTPTIGGPKSPSIIFWLADFVDDMYDGSVGMEEAVLVLRCMRGIAEPGRWRCVLAVCVEVYERRLLADDGLLYRFACRCSRELGLCT